MTRHGLHTKAALFHPMPRPGCAYPLRFDGRMRLRVRRGLLARTANGLFVTGQSTDAHAYYNADGNGNVTCLLNSKQAVVGRYLYDSYGNTLSLSGPQAEANPYRFSSKEYHVNAGLYYYGYRFYEPSLQRWPNRDPIQERGGITLHAFVGNNPVLALDEIERIVI